MGLAAALATLAIAYGIYRSRLGVGLFAIHDDEDVAEVLGVPTFQLQDGGVRGVVRSRRRSPAACTRCSSPYVTAGDTFTITVPLTVVLMSVLGGTRHWAGPAVGAAIITALLYAFTAGDHAVAGKAVFGAVLIVVILFMPQGVLGGFVARRRRKHVPATPAAMRGDDVPATKIVPRRQRSRRRPHPGRRAASARRFAACARLDGVDIDVRAGEILGLAGTQRLGQIDVHQSRERSLPARRRHARVSRARTSRT